VILFSDGLFHPTEMLSAQGKEGRKVGRLWKIEAIVFVKEHSSQHAVELNNTIRKNLSGFILLPRNFLFDNTLLKCIRLALTLVCQRISSKGVLIRSGASVCPHVTI
jgi:hypothetical protein